MFCSIATFAPKAAELRALVRRSGVPTTDPHALDAGAILAGKTLIAIGPGNTATLAPGNVRHLFRIPGVDALLWPAVS